MREVTCRIARPVTPKIPRQGFLPGVSNYLTKNVRIVVL